MWKWLTRSRHLPEATGQDEDARIADLMHAADRLKREADAIEEQVHHLVEEEPSRPGHSRRRRPRFRLIRGKRLAIPLAALAASMLKAGQRARWAHLGWAGAAASTLTLATTGTVYIFHQPAPPAKTRRHVAAGRAVHRHEAPPAPPWTSLPHPRSPWEEPTFKARYHEMGSGAPTAPAASPSPGPSPTAQPSPSPSRGPSPTPSPVRTPTPHPSVCVSFLTISVCVSHKPHHRLL
jgi:hypothetical protein